MISKNNSIIKLKNSEIKLSENNINIPNMENSSNSNNNYIKIFLNLAFMKIRTKSCDAKRKGVSKNNIERNRLALAEALNINKEVNNIFLNIYS